MKFEFFVAIRYLKAKRKQAVISMITLISVIGVAAGVAALVIALAINAGFREDLQKKLLGAQAHVQLIPQDRAGISDYLNVTKEVEKFPGVVSAAPSVYQRVLIHGSSSTDAAGLVKGIIPEFESRISSLSESIVAGDLSQFNSDAIVVGQDLANTLGVVVGDRVKLVSLETTLSPLGALPRSRVFRVAAIFQ